MQRAGSGETHINERKWGARGLLWAGGFHCGGRMRSQSQEQTEPWLGPGGLEDTCHSHLLPLPHFPAPWPEHESQHESLTSSPSPTTQ